MAFQKKTWTNRLAEYLTRRTLTDVTTGDVTTVEVARAEGEIYEDGDSLDADTMNDLEERIAAQFEEVGKGVGITDKYDNVMDMISRGEIEDGTFVNITDDSDDDSISALAIDYDNTNSGMWATEVQGAIDELSTHLTTNEDITVTPASGITINTSFSTFKKLGNKVTISCDITGTITNRVPIFNIPSNYRPSASGPFGIGIVETSTKSVGAIVTVNANGDVDCAMNYPINGASAMIHIEYMI